ncbi:MAG: hypothetical protein JKP90_20460 [Desulfofustis sp. PB-SRB1]|nr:hypothetical protein [Desulfofustis sp. PB-SRB1]
MNEPKQLIEKEVEAMAETLFSVSEFLLHNPETAYQEFKACEHISEVLRRNGFAVEEGAGDVGNRFSGAAGRVQSNATGSGAACRV